MPMLDVTLDQPKLLDALKTAATVCDRKSNNQPILASVLLRGDKAGLSFAATDMQVSSTETIAPAVDMTLAQLGTACAPVRTLLQIVSGLPSKPVRLRALENYWIEVTSGRINMKLMGQSAADFPELPEPKKTALVAVAATSVAEMIEKTKASISTDEARVNLNGVLFESTGRRMTMVSTDGHRLTKFSADFAGPKFERGVIIPRRAVLALVSMLTRAKSGQVELGVDGTGSLSPQHLFARSAGLTLALKLNNVVFPPYEQVIPKGALRVVTLDRVEFTRSLSRAVVMAPEKTATVTLTFASAAKTLHLKADNPDLGVVTDELDMEWSGEGGELLTGYNATYILEALASITSDKVSLSLQGVLDPMTIRPIDGPDFIAVVMPMRV